MATTSTLTKEKVVDLHDDRPVDTTSSVSSSSNLENNNDKSPVPIASPNNINSSEDDNAAKSSMNMPIQEPNSESLEHDVNDPRLMRASHFLCHPSTKTVSSSEKDSYLQRKGYSEGEISRAKIYAASAKEKGNLDRIWGSEDEGTRSGPKEKEPSRNPGIMNMPISQEPNVQGYYSPGNANAIDSPELPNVVVPLAIGGVLAMFGMAAFRWLNGGDFVLLPPSANSIVQNVSGAEIDANPGKNVETENLEYDSAGLDKGIYLEEDDNNIEERRDDNMEHEEDYFDNVPGIGQHSAEMPQHISKDSAIGQHLQSLTMAIEKHTSLQEDALKAKSNEKARDKTNSAMGLLLNKQSRDIKVSEHLGNSSPWEGERIQYPEFQMAVLVQLTEMKCALKSIAEIHANTSNEVGSDDLLIEKLEKIGSNLEGIKLHFCRAGVGKIDIPAHIEKENTSLNLGEKISPTKEIISSEDIECQENTKSDEHSIATPSPTKEVSRDDTSMPMCDQITADDDPTSRNELNSEALESDDVGEKQQLKEEQKNESIYASVGKEAVVEVLRKMKENNANSLVKDSCQMLSLYINNLVSNPASDKYSKIYTKNNTFKNKIGRVKFAQDVLIAIGFEEDERSFLRWNHAFNNNADGKDSTELSLSPLLQEAISLIQELQNQLK